MDDDDNDNVPSYHLFSHSLIFPTRKVQIQFLILFVLLKKFGFLLVVYIVLCRLKGYTTTDFQHQ